LPVGGAFTNDGTSKKEELAKAIEATKFSNPICPVYQNVTARGFKRNRNSQKI
jgi:[acyl-carrier-protein] S-malonyltransferase